MSSIPKRIEARLVDLQKTKHWLSKQLGLTPSAVYNWFGSGNRRPDNAQLGKLASVLDTTTDYLLGLTDDPTPRVDWLEPELAAKLAALDVETQIKLARNITALSQVDQDTWQVAMVGLGVSDGRPAEALGKDGADSALAPVLARLDAITAMLRREATMPEQTPPQPTPPRTNAEFVAMQVAAAQRLGRPLTATERRVLLAACGLDENDEDTDDDKRKPA